MSDIACPYQFPIILFIIMIALPAVSLLILCQFKKVEKKKENTLSVAHSILENDYPAFIDKTQTANSTALHPMEEDKAVKENMTANQTIMPVMKKQKSAETMHKTETHLWVKRNQGIGGYTAGSSLKKYNKSKKQRPKNHQIIGDLNTTDSSNEYSLENTLAMESFESIKGKPGLSLEGEEINHRMKTVEQSISSDYSLFDSQSSREDIRKQRSRLLRLDTSVARRAAAALEDSIVSAPTQDEQEKSAAEENRQRIPEVEGTQDNLVANS